MASPTITISGNGLEYPAVFTEALVRKILDGEKVETRRLVETERKRAPTWATELQRDPKLGRYWHWKHGTTIELGAVRCPYGMAGDRLWVREPIEKAADQSFGGAPVPSTPIAVYSADGAIVRTQPGDAAALISSSHPWVWKPRKLSGRFMPKVCARLWLRVVGVTVERVQQIDDAAAKREGLTSREDFVATWDRIHKRRYRATWHADPFVWVVRFEVAT